MGTGEHIMSLKFEVIKIELIRIRIESSMPLPNIKKKKKSKMLTALQVNKTFMDKWINSINLLI